MKSTPQTESVPSMEPLLLSSVPRGSTVEVVQVREVSACVQRLREFGLISNTEIEVIRSGDPLLICVRGTRLAIDRQSASCVEVRLAPPA